MDNDHYWKCSVLSWRCRLFKKSLNICGCWHWNCWYQTWSPLLRNGEISPCSGAIGEEWEVVLVSVEHICCDFERECWHWRVRFERLRWIWGYRVLRICNVMRTVSGFWVLIRVHHCGKKTVTWILGLYLSGLSLCALVFAIHTPLFLYIQFGY